MKDKTKAKLVRLTAVSAGTFIEGACRGAGVAFGIFWVAKKFGVLDYTKLFKN